MVIARAVLLGALVLAAGCYDFDGLRARLRDGGSDLQSTADMPSTGRCSLLPGNLLTPGDSTFRDGLGGWTGSTTDLQWVSELCGTDDNAVELCRSGTGAFMRLVGGLAPPATIGQRYTFSAWVKTGASVVLKATVGKVSNGMPLQGNTDWTQLQVSVSADAASDVFELDFEIDIFESDPCILIDDVSFAPTSL